MLTRTLVALGITTSLIASAQAAPETPAKKGAAAPAAATATAQPPPPAPAPGAPGAATPGAPAPAPSPEPAPDPSGGPSYGVRLKLMQNRVNDLKEKVHRSKLRIEAIKEMVLRGVVAGSRATIVHKNDMGSRFKLERVVYAIDGNVIYNKSDSGDGLFPAHWDPKLRIPRGQVVAAASIVSPKY